MFSKLTISCLDEGLTFMDALRRLPDQTRGLAITIDVTGLDEEIPEDVGLFTPASADQPRLNLNPSKHRTWAIDYPLAIRAVPTLVEKLQDDVILSVHPVHRMLAITAPGANWALDQHKDRFLVGAATPFVGGFIPPTPLPIIGNTVDTLYLAGSEPPAPPYEILEPGAHLRFGGIQEGGVGFVPSLAIEARGALGVQWVRFGRSSVANPSVFGLSLHSNTGGLVRLASCRFDAGLRVADGGAIDIDEAVFNDCPVAFEGFGMHERNFRHIAATNVSFSGHRGDYFAMNLRLRGCSPFGTQLTTNYSGYCDIENAEILSSTGDGLRFRGAHGQHRLRNAVIENCAGHAVVCSRNTHLIMRNVSGSGSAGAGLHVRDGAQVKVEGVVDVTGSMEIDAGGALGAQAWAAVPFAEFTADTAVRVHV